MKVLFPGDMARPASFSIQEFIHAILYPREGPLLEMLFVAVIMWMFILAPYWRICFKSKTLSTVTLIGLFALHLGADYLHLGTFLGLKDTARLGVYFYLGMLLSKYGKDDVFDKFKYVISINSLVLYIVFALIHFRLGMALSGIAFSIALAFFLDKYFPNALSSFRSYTYQIFLISFFSQIAVKMIYKRVSLFDLVIAYPSLSYITFFVMCLIARLYIPVFVSKIAEKINWYPILLCFGLNKK